MQMSRIDKHDWKNALLHTLSRACQKSTFRKDLNSRDAAIGIHLAVFTEPYLTYVLEGKKTVESRFGVTRQPPFERVNPGDILILKRSSGPVCGICRIGRVWFYHLDSKTWPEIERFSEALCMDGSEFWKKRKAASYATLMQIKDVHCIEEIKIAKLDPRAWVVVNGTPPRQGILNWKE